MTELKVMTFEQFQATSRKCADIGDAVGADMGVEAPVTGLLYHDALYIEDVLDEEMRKRGRYYLLIANEDWITDDLVELERKLYAYACAEGYIAPPMPPADINIEHQHTTSPKLDPLAEALRSNDLDETVRTIQTALGITTGDTAGQHFSTRDRLTYLTLEGAHARAVFVGSWLHAELIEAAYRAELRTAISQ